MRAIMSLSMMALVFALPLCFASCSDDEYKKEDKDKCSCGFDCDCYDGCVEGCDCGCNYCKYGFYDPMELVNTVWEAKGCNDDRYSFDGAKFHFGVSIGFIEDLQIGNWSLSSYSFSFEEGDNGYLRIIFNSSNKIDGYLSFENDNYATFVYHWEGEDIEFHMEMTCIAE